MQILNPDPPRAISLIVIHCSATPNGRPVLAIDIDAWHHARGFRRTMDWRTRQNINLSAIGYHFLIRINGALETGRHLDEIGAHAAGRNHASIGVCLAGTDHFTPRQWDTLKANVGALLRRYPDAKVCGHRDLPDVHKTCPGFSVFDWFSDGMTPPPAAVLDSGDLLRAAKEIT